MRFLQDGHTRGIQRLIENPPVNKMKTSKIKQLFVMFGVNIAATVFLLVLLEAIFFIANKNFPPENRINKIHKGGVAKGFFLPDENLGYKMRPNANVTAVVEVNGEKAYDAVYSTDGYGRRITPVDASMPKNKFILFFGCSFTFGEGVNDDQTFSYNAGKLMPEFRPYNYGCNGYGPQQMLARLEGAIEKEILEADGMAVYFFIDDHVQRAVGSRRIVSQWGRHMPYYAFDSKGRLVRNKDFKNGRPFKDFLYRLLSKSQIVRYFNIDFPFRITAEHMRLVSRMIEQSRDMFKQKFSSNNFYVAFDPKSSYAKKLIPYLRKAGIRYLEFSRAYYKGDGDIEDGRLYIKGDGHPSGHAYKLAAEIFVQNLPKLTSRYVNVPSTKK